MMIGQRVRNFTLGTGRRDLETDSKRRNRGRAARSLLPEKSPSPSPIRPPARNWAGSAHWQLGFSTNTVDSLRFSPLCYQELSDWSPQFSAHHRAGHPFWRLIIMASWSSAYFNFYNPYFQIMCSIALKHMLLRTCPVLFLRQVRDYKQNASNRAWTRGMKGSVRIKTDDARCGLNLKSTSSL